MNNCSIFTNSYVIFIVAFIVFYVIFYLFGVGFDYETDENGKVTKTFCSGWKYPLAIALVVWVAAHYFIFPQDEDTLDKQAVQNQPAPMQTVKGQQINMAHWY